MVDSMKSNVGITLKETISTTATVGDTFFIFETGIVVEDASVVFYNETQIERFQLDIATTGECTIVLRGLENSEAKVASSGLNKEWNAGAKGYITILAFNLFNKDVNANTQVIKSDVETEGSFEAKGITKPNPVVANDTERDALYPSPEMGDTCINGGELQKYNSITVQRETLDVGTPTPNASESVTGKVKVATDSEFDNETDSAGGIYNMPKISDIIGLVDSKLKSTQSSFVAGEDLTAGQPVCIIPDLTEAVNTQGTGGTGGAITTSVIGYDSTAVKLGHKFRIDIGNRLTKIDIELRQNGSPTGNLTCKVYSDTGSTLIATSTNTIAESSVSSSWGTDYTFTFSNEVLANGDYYWELSTDRADSTLNYILTTSDSTYADGTLYNVDSSGVWTSNTGKANFKVYTTYVSEGKIRKTKADNTSRLKFIGFVEDTVSALDDVKVNTTGTDDNQTSLSIGDLYYLSDTIGTISTTPGSNNVKVGRAISDTQILINPGGGF